MTTKVKHPDRLAEQVNNIITNPKSWWQGVWHSDCGTKHCIAGHGQIAAGRPVDNDTCKVDAREWYGLTDVNDSDWLFHCDRTLTELYEFARLALVGEAYFDADGLDYDGLDCDGYDCDGFNRDGYNSKGYNSKGYNSRGLNRNGFDCSGYNRSGYNRRGLDRNGDSLPLLNITGDK